MTGYFDDPMRSVHEENSAELLRFFLLLAQDKYFPSVPYVADIEIVDDLHPACLTPSNVIQLSRNVILSQKMCKVLILHELIHHALRAVTGDPDEAEGAVFQAQVDRLWNEGAYRGLL